MQASPNAFPSPGIKNRPFDGPVFRVSIVGSLDEYDGGDCNANGEGDGKPEAPLGRLDFDRLKITGAFHTSYDRSFEG
jgi:hypothetical protein